eukprot:CAMPEP_0173066302 /NCGR_PEP_ID=MMETSP1102-20130122/6127_1 /TAXON_ID=49646 /ORGANISM="Geminigera sp., Strain Caron Lab Isolate" /LENGTH=663 /DNA_ID=CAMNT_0013933727 /DNA_START=8 /DNA_END=1995 /DNA_ORIENTATION=+
MPSMQTRQKVTAFAAAGGTALLLALMVVSNTESSRYAELLQHEGVAESFSGAPALKPELGRQTQLSDIFSAPLELAKSKIDSAINNDEEEEDPAAQLNVARTPCLAGSTDTDCTKHWAAHYMSRATEAIDGPCNDCDDAGSAIETGGAAGDISIGAITKALAKKLRNMKQEFRVIKANFVSGPAKQMDIDVKPRGPRGFTGSPGNIGLQGNVGEPGGRGAPGMKGHRGPDGRMGPRGRKGKTGMVGAMGEAGIMGAQGGIGVTGPIGFTGARGSRGLPGAAGAPGSNGADGIPGPVGTNSPDGEPGPPGASGEPGASGDAGKNGDRGPAGRKGESGANGLVGPDGGVGVAGLAGVGPPKEFKPVAKETALGPCYVRSANCGAYNVAENLCGVCEGADWQKCSNDGGWCTCTGRVRYGEGDNWSGESSSIGQIYCGVDKFDRDPSPGHKKTCECAHGFKLTNSLGLQFNGKSFDDNNYGAGSYQARNVCLLARYGNQFVNKEKKCADQGGSCVCDGNVRLGIGSSWSPPVRVKGAIMCAAGKDFKDPAPSKAKVCMCSSAQYPNYPTTESFAMPASSKAKEAVHFYGNCNSQNSDSYGQQQNCCINSRLFPAGRDWSQFVTGNSCDGDEDVDKMWGALTCYGTSNIDRSKPKKDGSPAPPPPPP